LDKNINIEHILKVLPHAHPFILIDRVLVMEQDSYIHAYKNITYNEPYFKGHFPRKPVMPGALIIESLAQAIGVLSLSYFQLSKESNELFMLAGIDKVKFRSMVVPGDQLHLHCHLEKKRGKFVKYSCEARVDEKIVTTAELMLVVEKVEECIEI
jgi:3-hydroxyacyl-[acyl-carrier-protein] dehydratase